MCVQDLLAAADEMVARHLNNNNAGGHQQANAHNSDFTKAGGGNRHQSARKSNDVWTCTRMSAPYKRQYR